MKPKYVCWYVIQMMYMYLCTIYLVLQKFAKLLSH